MIILFGLFRFGNIFVNGVVMLLEFVFKDIKLLDEICMVVYLLFK